jgi:transketolase
LICEKEELNRLCERKVQTEAVDAKLIELTGSDARIVALSADMADRIISRFSRECRGKFFNMGITEQDMVGAAAGMSKCGLVPFMTTLAAFLSMRACEQLRTDLVYAKANVKIIVSGGGLVYGTLGATHQGLEDLGILRTISSLVVIAPVDYEETVWEVKAAAAYEGPLYIRLGRGAVPAVHAPVPCTTSGLERLRK